MPDSPSAAEGAAAAEYDPRVGEAVGEGKEDAGGSLD